MKAFKVIHILVMAGLLVSACSVGNRPSERPPATTQPPTSAYPAYPAYDTPLPPPIVSQATESASPSEQNLPARPATISPPPSYPTCEADPNPPLDLSTGQLVEGESSGSESALRPLADQRGLHLGAAISPGMARQPETARLLVKHFNTIIPSNAMKWEFIHPEPDRYDFTDGDALVAFAEANGMTMYGHNLVWDLQQPEWLTRSEVELAGQRSRDEWIQILCRHIKTVVSHYRGHIYAWHVVNEPFNNDGSLRDTLWMRVIGPEHIAMAFQWAHEADPQAKLILNEFYAEGLNEKSQAVYSMVQGLLQLGVPLDGVGLQMHVWLGGPPTPAELAANMQRLADLGLEAHITEMDVRTQYSHDPPEVELAAQAEQYRQALQTCLEAVNCNVFMTWGLTDRDSWIPDYTGKPDAPLLFDEQGRPKPAFDAILELLQ